MGHSKGQLFDEFQLDVHEQTRLNSFNSLFKRKYPCPIGIITSFLSGIVFYNPLSISLFPESIQSSFQRILTYYHTTTRVNHILIIALYKTFIQHLRFKAHKIMQTKPSIILPHNLILHINILPRLNLHHLQKRLSAYRMKRSSWNTHRLSLR